jgi:hypothetical protein
MSNLSVTLQVEPTVAESDPSPDMRGSDLDNNAVPCYNKKPVNGRMAADEGRAILAAAEATRGVKGAKTVRLVEVREDENRLTTERVSSSGNLFNHLWASTTPIRFRREKWNRERLGIAGQSLGAWLRAYHAGTSVSDRDSTDAQLNVSQQCRGRIKHIATIAPSLLAPPLVNRLHDRIAALERSSTAASNKLSAIHGDLNLSNVLVERGTGELVIIDFGNWKTGLGIEDVATVYCTVHSMIVAKRRSAKALAEFLVAFVDAYGRNQLEPNPMWPLMQIMCYLRLVNSYFDFKEKGKFSWLTGRAYWQISRGSLALLAKDCEG